MIVSLYILFEFLSILLCLHYLYGEKLRFDLITLSVIAIEIIWMQVIYCFGWDLRLSLAIYPVIMLYCGIKFGFHIKPILINNILYVIILGFLQFCVMTFLNIAFEIVRINELGALSINVFNFCIVVFLLKKWNLKKVSVVLQSREALIWSTLIVTIVIVVVSLTNYKKNNGFDIPYYLLFVTCCILITFAVVDIGKHKIKVREKEAELKLYELYEESFQNLIDEISARQHEFDNHINVIYNQHFFCKTYGELVDMQRKYCKQITGENYFNKLLSKGNPIILGFLYSKFTEIINCGIALTYSVNIETLKSSVPIHKIVELLGNLIKNAVEALDEYKDSNKIHVVIIENGEKILIEVGNESPKIDYYSIQSFFRKGYSEKGKNRGYGLYTVKKICDEYHIKIECENKNFDTKNWLVFRLIINKALSN